jgi:hypothetical protein
MAKFEHLPTTVDVILVTRPMTIQTPRGTLDVVPGELLVTNAFGENYPITLEIFEYSYEPKDDEAIDLVKKAKEFNHGL